MKKYCMLLIGIFLVGCNINEKCDSQAYELIGTYVGLSFSMEMTDEDWSQVKTSTWVISMFEEKLKTPQGIACSDLSVIESHITELRNIAKKYK